MSDRELKKSDFVLYTSADGEVKIDVFFQGETVWLNQKMMVDLFDVNIPAISKHLNNIYEEGELEKEATISILETVQTEGGRRVKRNVEYYNLDAIIAVGYRVNSKRATQFRIWATKTLRDFIIKGFAIDEERLKNGSHFGKDYFEELLEKIREIRASERRFYKKITDIYAQCSIDYDPKSEITQKFYATVQNKLHWAITGETAAELIAHRADNKKPHMGLTTSKGGPKNKILKTDIIVAKNYLDKKEIDELNHIVTMYLDYAELQTKKQVPMKMADWVNKLDAFLKFNDYQILDNPGNVSAEVAKNIADKEYEKFRIRQDREFESDFDQVTKEILNKGKAKK